MIKLSILMVRRADLSYDQYLHHWREVHGPLFVSQEETKTFVRRYVQSHRANDELRGTTASRFDGIAEIWFEDMRDAQSFFASTGYRDNVIPDEEAFMDRTLCQLLWSNDTVVIA